MRSKSIAAKVFLTLSTIIVAVIVSESLLRLAAHFRSDNIGLSSEDLENITAADVVCIGNSHTYGMGIPQGESYCDQFEKIAIEHGVKLKTQNWSQPLFNTANILKDLEKKIPPAKPKIALVMAGESNLVDFRGFGDYQKRRQEGQQNASKGSAWNSIQEKMSSLRLIQLINGKAKSAKGPESESSDLPFEAINKNNKLEIAYRWLSWARSNYWEVRLSDEQARGLMQAMQLIKENDPSNLAADLVASEVEAIQFQDQDKAIEILQSIPKSHEACLAFIEAPSLEGLSRDLPPLIQGKMIPTTTGQYVQAIFSARSKWEARLSSDEKKLLDKITKRQTITAMSSNALDKSKKLRSLFETLSDCGSVADGTVKYLMASYLRTADYGALLNLMLHQSQIFPLSPYSDSLQVLNFVREFLKPSSKIDSKIKLAYKNHNLKFGDLGGDNVLISKSGIEAWTEGELTEVIKFLESNGVRVVLMTYPPLPHRGLHPVKKTPVTDLPSNDADMQIHRVSEAASVPLFDTYNLLRPQFLEVKDLSRFYSFAVGKLDPHLSSAGHKMIGEELYRYLENKNMLSSLKSNH